MNENRDYYLNALSMILQALAPILILYGVISQEQAGLWISLIMAIAAVIIPLAIGQVAQNWTKQRAAIEVARLTSQ